MENTSLPLLVRQKRFELSWVAPLPPQSSASTSFATAARQFVVSSLWFVVAAKIGFRLDIKIEYSALYLLP